MARDVGRGELSMYVVCRMCVCGLWSVRLFRGRYCSFNCSCSGKIAGVKEKTAISCCLNVTTLAPFPSAN